MAELALEVTLARGSFELAVTERVPLDGITVLFGPSGSGKTTLLRVVAGLERHARGRVAFDGVVWQSGRRSVPAHRRGIGYVFQDGRLFPHLTVAANLDFAVRRAPRAAPAVDREAAIAALGLADLLERKPGSLSGGEQQRVAIGRALLGRPRLLLMDEPLSSLDLARKREIVPLIERLPAAFGVPVLYVTHDLDEAARLASSVLVLNRGKIVACGPAAAVLERLDSGALVGEGPSTVLEARVESAAHGIATLRLGAHGLRVPVAAPRIGERLRIRIAARDVAIALEQPRRLSIRNVLPATVHEIADGGDPVHAEVVLEVDGRRVRSLITREALDELALTPGSEVFALIKSVALEGTLLG